MEDYGQNNNIKLESRIPWRCNYAFIDTPDHRADKLFIRAEIPVRFERREMGHPDFPYVLVFCHFNKRYENGFLECMADLERTMLLEGHADYRETCEKFLGPVLEDEASKTGSPKKAATMSEDVA